MSKALRSMLFNLLRLYVWCEQTRAGAWLVTRAIPYVRGSRAFLATARALVLFLRWWRGQRADVILEPLPRLRDDRDPETGDDVPEVHEQRSVYVTGDGRAAYTSDAGTMRRVAINEQGDLVYIRRADKKTRRAMKRAKAKRHGTSSEPRA